MHLPSVRIYVPVLMLFAIARCEAGRLDYQVTEGGVNRYTYYLLDIALAANQELSIVFPPALFGAISNPVAAPGFDVLLFQPNNPPGTSGLFTALALTDNPPLTVPFSVDFTLIGPGRPGSQQFFISQYDQQGDLVRIVESGFTSPSVPEPAMFVPAGFLLIMGGAVRAVRRHFSKAA